MINVNKDLYTGAYSVYLFPEIPGNKSLGFLRLETVTFADNHLRGCYGVTGGVGRAQKLAMRRAPGLDDIGGESGRRRPEGASCEDSDLGSFRR
ncbi:jg12464 [Pararge aegeria aegeria]|uniref:Jg12464 protein n=1 Tax=Pararge aegeria aegeria TaxID=348720 RepID=A0A8S4RPL8_9NEOP|nr:jg12464 [Pararge aegeria aegeria]